MIHTGDCLDVLPTLHPESIDAIVTDPPYGLGFMGKEWDRLEFAGGGNDGTVTGTGINRNSPRFYYQKGPDQQAWHEAWAREALRVAKPGAYLLAFGGTRTVHRLACAVEDAGWIIRDLLVWGYASGFPKGKANLKPAWEPIVMARKPGPLRPLDIDGCRIGIGADDPDLRPSAPVSNAGSYSGGFFGGMIAATLGGRHDASGRWPANVILTDPIFDGGWDGVVGGGETHSQDPATRAGTWRGSFFGAVSQTEDPGGYGDSGTYSRFFLVPKAARSDREPVLGGLPERELVTHGNREQGPLPQQTPQGPIRRANHHPTVKPTDLMRHLVRLVTPQGGTVLDPFLGSGTTALAAELEGFAWVGIEREAEYVAIAEARLNGTQRGLGLDSPAPTPRMPKQTDDIGWNGLGGFHEYANRHAAGKESDLVDGADPQLFPEAAGPEE